MLEPNLKSSEKSRTITLRDGTRVEVARIARGWVARSGNVSAIAETARGALTILRPMLPPPSPAPRLNLTRGDYEVYYRASRLAPHSVSDLMRLLAELRRKIAQDAAQQAAKQRRRRARYAAAIRAHRVVRQAWRDLNDEVRDWRAIADEAWEEAGRQRTLAELCRRDAEKLVRMRAALIEARCGSAWLQQAVPDPLRDPEGSIRALIELAQRSAEYHRRATAAEAREQQAMAGQQAIIAAARLAGLEYVVEQPSGAARFVPEGGDQS